MVNIADLKTLTFTANLSAENKGDIVPANMVRNVYRAKYVGLASGAIVARRFSGVDYFNKTGAEMVVTIMGRYNTSDSPMDIQPLNQYNDWKFDAPVCSDIPIMKFVGSSYIRAQTSSPTVTSGQVQVVLTFADEKA